MVLGMLILPTLDIQAVLRGQAAKKKEDGMGKHRWYINPSLGACLTCCSIAVKRP